MITGLPFPPTKDPKIILKKSILDEAVVPLGELVSHGCFVCLKGLSIAHIILSVCDNRN